MHQSGPTCIAVATHVQLLPLEDVPIRPTRLSWPRSDSSEKSSSLELSFEERVDLGVLLAFLKDALDVVGLLLGRVFLGHLGAAEDGLGVLAASSDLLLE
jgi:hypothetical protein